MKHDNSSCSLNIRFLRTLSLTSCLLAAFWLPAQESSKKPHEKVPPKEEFPVKMEVAAGKPDAEGMQQIVVTLELQKGYYLYANPTGNEFLQGAQTIMKVTGKTPLDAKIAYPKGEVVKDEVAGDYWIYKGKVTLKAEVRRVKGDSEPLSVAVRVRPMDPEGCRWLPRLLKATVP